MTQLSILVTVARALIGLLLAAAGPPSARDPKDHETQGSCILVPRAKARGIPEIMVCRILLFMWSSGPRSTQGSLGGAFILGGAGWL